MSGTEVVKSGGGFLAAETDMEELAREAAPIAGAGTSQDRADNLVPFLVVLQDMSPQVKPREPDYIEGAVAGMIMRTDTKKLYEKALFQPCVFQKKVVEWVPRNAGGGGGKGFVATYEVMPDNAKNVVKDGKVNKNAFYNPENGNLYVETRYHFGNLLDEESGSISPAVIGMASTQHTVSRGWMALMNQFRLNGLVAPSFFRCYQLGTTEKRNPQGTWFVFSVRDMGWVSKPLRDLGHKLHAEVEAGDKVAEEPARTGEEEGEKEVPF